MSGTDIDNLLPLRDIVDLLDKSISYKQLTSWASRREMNDFPEPAEVIGKYHLYDPEEVIRWVTLWRKVNKHLGNKKLNGRSDG